VILALIAAAVAAASIPVADSTPILRGRESPSGLRVVALDADGVTVEGGDGSTRDVLGWERIAGVEGPLGAEAAAFARTADAAWRARARLDRGDIAGAEPLFEELFASYEGRRGPTSAGVAAGLLRCRLLRGAQTGAVAPWLAYLEAAGQGTPTAGVGAAVGAGVVMDGPTGLVPALPPIWLDVASVRAFARTPASAEDGGRASAMGALYRAAARIEAGLGGTLPPEPTDDAGLRLVWEVVASRGGDESLRTAAREALTARLGRALPAWTEAWCRVAIGRSLLKETAREARLLGVAELLELPARLEGASPYLTGVAMAEAAVALVGLDDVDGAVSVRADLQSRLPGHPALEWEPIRGWSGVDPAFTQPPPAEPVAPASPITPSVDAAPGDPP